MKLHIFTILTISLLSCSNKEELKYAESFVKDLQSKNLTISHDTIYQNINGGKKYLVDLRLPYEMELEYVFKQDSTERTFSLFRQNYTDFNLNVRNEYYSATLEPSSLGEIHQFELSDSTILEVRKFIVSKNKTTVGSIYLSQKRIDNSFIAFVKIDGLLNGQYHETKTLANRVACPVTDS